MYNTGVTKPATKYDTRTDLRGIRCIKLEYLEEYTRICHAQTMALNLKNNAVL